MNHCQKFEGRALLNKASSANRIASSAVSLVFAPIHANKASEALIARSKNFTFISGSYLPATLPNQAAKLNLSRSLDTQILSFGQKT